MHKGYIEAKKSFLRSLNIISNHKTAFLGGTIIPSILGIFLAEIIMAAPFNALQPIMAGTTLITVEIFGVFLVDFPMSVVAGCIIAKKQGNQTLNMVYLPEPIS